MTDIPQWNEDDRVREQEAREEMLKRSKQGDIDFTDGILEAIQQLPAEMAPLLDTPQQIIKALVDTRATGFIEGAVWQRRVLARQLLDQGFYVGAFIDFMDCKCDERKETEVIK